MRRVFPLRPAEANLLVTYDNDTFEQEPASSLPPPSALHLKHCRRSSAKSSSAPLDDDRTYSPSSALGKVPSRPAPLQKLLSSSSSDYLEFAEACNSPTAPSSLWASSFFDDGDSTSFNSSDGTRRRHTSCTSSSTSSSITFNPQDLGSSSAISSYKGADALLDIASSCHKASVASIRTGDESCNELNDAHLHDKTQNVDVVTYTVKPTLKPLAIAKPQNLTYPEIPTYVIPRKIEEYIQNCMDVPSHRSLSSPKVSDRPRELAGNGVHLSRTIDSPRGHRTATKPLLTRNESEACSCTIPFKYLTKCLRAEKRNSASRKGEGQSQPNSPAKFLTLTNRLYSPQLSPRTRLPLDGDVDVRDKNKKDQSRVGDASTAIPQEILASRAIVPMASGADSISDVNCQSSLKCQSFGSAMISDYLQRLGEEAKSGPLSKTSSSASFKYDSDSDLWKVSRPRSAGSMDFSSKSFNLYPGLDGTLARESGKKLVTTNLSKTSKSRSYSMDVLARLGRDGSTCSSRADEDESHLDYSSSSELFVAEEKNAQKLALLELKINKLCEEKRILARELAAEMKARHRAQEFPEIALRNMEAKMEGKLISAEKDHAYAQACLEQEMDRRKKEWSAKLDKIRVQEKRLRDRVTEMAIERVELQKAIAMHKEREVSLQAQARDHELSARTWMQRHCQSEEEILLLRKSFTNACNRLGNKECELDLVRQRNKILERENAELLKEISRLRKAYADEEHTFEELWRRLVDIVDGPSDSKLESLRTLHRELKAFAAREQGLRHEINVLQFQLLKMKQRTTGEDLSSTGMCFLEEQLRSLKNSTGKSSESVEKLINKLELTKQHTCQVEHQLEIKEEEVELLYSALQEREAAANDLQAELASAKAQRDDLRKQVQHMSEEATRLTQELTEMKQVVEKLDDELMLKEGEISILRDTCSDSDF